MGMFDFVGDLIKPVTKLIEPVTKFAQPVLDYFTGGMGTLATSAMDMVTGGLGNLVKEGIPNLIGNAPSTALDYYLKGQQANQVNDRSIENTQLAWDLNQKSYAKRYQATAQDMYAAGINPIMAATGGFNVGNAPQVAAPQAFMAQPAAVPPISSASAEFSQAEKNKAEVEEVGYKIKKITQEVAQSVAYIDKLQAEKNLFDEQSAKVWQETKNLTMEFTRIAADIVLKQQETRVGMAEEAKLHEDKRYLQKLGKEIELRIIRLEKVADAFKGPGGGLLGYLSAIMDSANTGVGVVLPLGRRK